MTRSMNRGTQTVEHLTLAITAFLCITIFSTCSFIYPTNPWDDANVFMTIGKSMLAGKRLYLEICDQKGPVLFFLHEMAAAISSRSFLGIYFVELICFYMYLHYSFKIMRLFSGSSIVLPLTCMIGVLTVSSDFFFYGDSVEELVLPIFSHCLYHMLAYIRSGRLPGWRQMLAIGIGAGIVFWLKFNLMIFYVGALVALLVIAYRHKMQNELWRGICWIIGGMLLVTSGVILYFAANGTLDALWKYYFHNNLFLYHGSNSNGEPPFWWFKLVKLGIWTAMTMPILFFKVNKDIKLLVVLSYGLLLLSFSVLTVQLYYFLIIFAFSPLFIYFFRNIRNTRRVYIAFILITMVCTAFNWNVVNLLSGTLPVKNIKMAEIINADHSEDSEVLNFCSYDTGIYVLTDRLPLTKYHFMPNIQSEEVRKEQACLAESGRAKYLVRRIGRIRTIQDYYNVPIPTKYKLICYEQEKYRYRFLTGPLNYLWNLGYPQVILKHIMSEPDKQECFLYKRID